MKATALIAATLATISLAFIGCENESAGSASLSVSPGFAKLKSGESVTFSVSGGWDCHWTLSDSSCGTLSASSGQSVVYTATRDNVSQIITLRAMTGGSSSAQVQATVAQGSEEYTSNITPTTSSSTSTSSSSNTNGEDKALTISPSSYSLEKGTSHTFTASGGNGAYSWSLSNNGYGTLNKTTGSSVTYTAKNINGTDILTQRLTVSSVVNGTSQSATAEIRQGAYGENSEINLRND